MAKYIHTGKINFPKTLLAFVIGIALSFVIGCGYAFLMDLCPFIILDIVIIAAIIIILTVMTMAMVKFGVVRSRIIKFLLASVFSITCWYTAWAYLVKHDFPAGYADVDKTFSQISRFLDTHSFSIGKMTSSASLPIEGVGMWILAGIEALLFLIPVFAAFGASKDYFCESCQTFNEDKTFYIEDAPGDDGFLSAEYSGNFNEQAKLPRTLTLPSILERKDLARDIYQVEISHCPSCKKNGVINVTKGKYKIEDKKTVLAFDSKKKILQDTLVDDFSIQQLIS